MTEFKLSDDELTFFSENGWAGPFPSPFDPADMARCLAAVEATGATLTRHSSPRTPVYDFAEIDFDAINPNLPRAFVEYFLQRNISNRDHHLFDAAPYRLLSHPAVTDRVASILGPDLLLWRSQYFPVLAGGEHPRNPGQWLGWHQGANFTGFDGQPSVVPGQALTAWIALTPTDEASSTLVFLPGSHKNGPAPLTNDGRAGRFYDQLSWRLDEGQAEPVCCRPGEFVLFDEYLIHSSTANKTDRMRLALTGRYAAAHAYVNKETWPFDPEISPDATDPHATGLAVPRLKYPLRDCAVDNYGVRLDRWGCLLVRGEDRWGWNRMATPPVD